MNIRRAAFATTAVVLLTALWALPVVANLGLMSGDAAEVAYTDGDGVSLRDAAGIDAGLLATLPEAFPVTIDDGPYTLDDGSSWYAVTAETELGTLSGWVHAGYLAGDSPAGIEFIDDSDSAAAGVPLLVATGGDDLNLRAGPSAADSVVDVIPDGAIVDVLAPALYDADGVAWSQVRFNGSVGYAAATFIDGALAVGDGLLEVEPIASTELVLGGETSVAWTDGDGVFVRAEPAAAAGPLTSLEEGAAVVLVDGPLVDDAGDAWYLVENTDAYGWVHSAYLSAGAATAQLAGGGVTGSQTGAAFVAEAYLYLGVPYVWAGSTPDGFDCSGFTYFIVNQVLGNDFPRALEEQLEYGYEVASDELLPGDLIYFQNTYQWGLSHIGFYVGDGQFISATGEHGAVGISNLTDPYWSARYVTARRIA